MVNMSRELLRIARLQCGVVSRQQAIESGLAPAAVATLVRTRRWVTLRRGVYYVYPGNPGREAALWAVVLRAGRCAVLSHQTAAELYGLRDEESVLIHLSVPRPRHITGMAGVVVHRSAQFAAAAQLNMSPPRTRIEDTVLDLAEQAQNFEAAFNLACTACRKRLTTAAKLREAMARRGKMRWRSELAVALADIGSGVHSLLEYRYVRLVERPHGLPRATRQAKAALGGKTCYLDDLYAEYRLGVELDGRQAHPDDRRWLDIRRDNAAAAAGLTILRYGWAEVNGRPCVTAAEIGTALQHRGWPGVVRPCSRTCQLPTP
jgi:hypothetical protein